MMQIDVMHISLLWILLQITPKMVNFTPNYSSFRVKLTIFGVILS